MIHELDYKDAYDSLAKLQEEIFLHNESILSKIEYDPNDFKMLLAYGYSSVTGKMDWVSAPKIKKQIDPEVFGVFTICYVDQWTTGEENDSYEGFMYVKVEGLKKFLKIPYSG
jgi:hypothetical protein